jgi:mRNA interferase MazF
MVARGEIWLARLDPTEGRELRKTRPCLVVSPPEIHNHLDIVIVVPMTTKSHPARYRIEATLKGKSGRFLLEQIRSIDKSRLLRRVGEAESKALSATLDTLRAMFVA